METDDAKPAADGQAGACGAQCGFEFVEFAIDVDANGLETAGRRVSPGFAANRALDDCGELDSRNDGFGFPRRDDGPCDPAGRLLLAEAPEHARNVCFAGAVEPVSGGDAAAGIHAHVEGAGYTETEASGRIFELGRRDADIQQDAVDPANSILRGKDLPECRIGAVHDLKARIGSLQVASDRHGVGVPIEGEQPATRTKLLKDGTRVSPAPKSPIDIEAVGPNGQKLQHLVLEDRHM